MIYLCQTCGYRINQRTQDRSWWQPDEPLQKTGIPDEDVGKHLIYNHMPFCSEDCIEMAKTKPHILQRLVTPANLFERGQDTWKTQRKIRRQNYLKKSTTN